MFTLQNSGVGTVLQTAVIFRERLLGPSETFIAEQARSLRQYRPVLAGLRRTTPSLSHSIPEVLLRDGDGALDKVAANLFRNVPVGRRFFARLKAQDPAIVHAHFAIDAVQALPIARKLRVPLLVSLHGSDVTSTRAALAASFAGRHYWRHRDRLFQDASAFICVSRFLRAAAIDAGFPASKLHVHYTGIDCERFQPSAKPRDSHLILFVGRLVEVKGCEYLLRAMAQVQQHDPQAHLEILGDGPLRSQLEALARELSIRACFRGVQSPDAVLESMQRARILCNPSATSSSGQREGFGMVFAEAQAVGTPVVSFAHAAIPEAVCHGETGLLCEERNVGGLANALQRLLDDDALWTRMSHRASEWVRERFDIARQSAHLESLYDDCVDDYRRTAASRRNGADWQAEPRSVSEM